MSCHIQFFQSEHRNVIDAGMLPLGPTHVPIRSLCSLIGR
ncbi:hypothetical protein T12_16413 [Trichinella patagoniensis]|uniref:Uncharacterized protein n=1 Tax=Trichinella patagoniensis TaxID=990121 RepID=A0A0V0YZB6_9BILA|nr:hypothetical protein T12_16413 [Trichinella patagoniensis]